MTEIFTCMNRLPRLGLRAFWPGSGVYFWIFAWTFFWTGLKPAILQAQSLELPQVASFSLIDANTEQVIRTISPGEKINLATLPSRSLTIRANTNPLTVGSVKMVLSGQQSKTQVESAAPYALFGDYNGNYNGWTPQVGSYSLTATPFTASGGGGTAGTPLSIDFSITDQATSSETFTLTLASLGNGTITKDPDLAAYPANSTLSLKASPATGYVFSGWSGDASGTANPLAVVMDRNKNIQATFTQVTGQQVVSFSLIDANTEQVIRAISPGEKINLATLPSRSLNIRINTNPLTVGSVKMVLSGQQSKTQVESAAPYALFGDYNGNYNGWTPQVGSYSLTATPFTASGGGGTAGTPLSIDFSIVDLLVGDADQDGVRDDVDACPGTPAGTRVDASGCPLVAVSALNRHMPVTETTSASSLIFRLIFSRPVTGVDVSDFELALSNTARGTISKVAAATPEGDVYDITVQPVSGNGQLGLNLKSVLTGITDLQGNLLAGGFTGQVYTIQQAAPTPGFAAVTPLKPLRARVDATKEKHQSKVFTHAGYHWAVLADSTGTNLWRLDGTSWTRMQLITTRNYRADVLADGNLVHILLYGGSASTDPPYVSLVTTLEYVAETNTYKAWSGNPGLVQLPLDAGIETASLVKDGKGLLWVVNAGTTEVNARWSAPPYSSWSKPLPIASGISDDDIAAAIYLPAEKRIGVLWSNQSTQRFGFSTHLDGTEPGTWTSDEKPAAASAKALGRGMADDHLNLKAGSDGTLYAAVKTSYDTVGETELGLLVRRPGGTWDSFYEVAPKGSTFNEDPTQPIVLLNEQLGRLRVVYTSRTNGGDILYRESAVSTISFGAPLILIPGTYNYATSIHESFSDEVVILASDDSQVVGVLASDLPGVQARRDLSAKTPGAAAMPESPLRSSFTAFPNPFTSRATLRFVMPQTGEYVLSLFDSRRMSRVWQQAGHGEAGAQQELALDGANLAAGLYVVQLQTPGKLQTLKLVLVK